MKLATYSAGKGKRLGAVRRGSDHLVDLDEAHYARTGKHDRRLLTLQGLIDAGEQGLHLARAVVADPPSGSLRALSLIRLHAPLEPVALRCCSVFEEHHEASVRAVRRMQGQASGAADVTIPPLFRAVPAYFKGSHLNVIGPEDEMPWPSFGDNMDFELELAAVIGTGGRDVSLRAAKSHIFGYTIFNDMSARVPQLEEMTMRLGPAKSKDFDGANILGPYVVTADELDGDDVLGIARVNGQELGRCSTKEMGHDWSHIIAYRSLGETMHPGEVITCGAFPGCNGIEHLRFLEPGDVIELELEGIGILRNRIGRRPAKPQPWPPKLI